MSFLSAAEMVIGLILLRVTLNVLTLLTRSLLLKLAAKTWFSTVTSISANADGLHFAALLPGEGIV